MPRSWAMLLVVAVQVGILVMVPLGKVLAIATGTRITLRTAPVDPYDLLSGYYMRLTYEVEDPDSALVEDGLERGDRVWITVRRAEPVWEIVSIRRGRPPAAADEVSLPAEWRGHRAAIEGAGRIYLPESQRKRAEDLNRELSGRGLVDLAVGDDGTVAVLRLRLSGETFGEQ